MNRLPFIFLLLIATGLSVYLRKLTLPAALTGAVVAIVIYTGAGWTGIAMMALFFILGTAATSCQLKAKQASGIAEIGNGKRKVSQVLANAGVAAIAGALIQLLPHYTILLRLMLAAAFSSASSDTLSSELGNVYGKRFYNILSWKPDHRGRDGVVSLEGTAAGLAGSVLIAIVYVIGYGSDAGSFAMIVLAGTIGNLSDSVMGASWERKQYLHNDAVNFLNTLIAALCALLLYELVN